MAKTLKATSSRDSARKQAVIYARVSSKEQEKEGFSIPAQLKLLKEYAAAHGCRAIGPSQLRRRGARVGAGGAACEPRR
jgi:predicted site-specific integrase-resolvase